MRLDLFLKYTTYLDKDLTKNIILELVKNEQINVASVDSLTNLIGIEPIEIESTNPQSITKIKAKKIKKTKRDRDPGALITQTNARAQENAHKGRIKDNPKREPHPRAMKRRGGPGPQKAKKTSASARPPLPPCPRSRPLKKKRRRRERGQKAAALGRRQRRRRGRRVSCIRQ